MCTCVFFLTDAPLLNGSTHRTPVRKILSYIQRTTELLKTKKHSCQDPSQITSSPHDMFIPTPKYLCKTSWVPRGLRISEKSFFIDELTITDIGWPAKNMSQFSKREKKSFFNVLTFTLSCPKKNLMGPRNLKRIINSGVSSFMVFYMAVIQLSFLHHMNLNHQIKVTYTLTGTMDVCCLS